MQTIDVPATSQPGADGVRPTPARIFDTLINSHARADALKAAIELEVFTAIAQGAQNVEALAQRCVASERGVRTLCDFLVVNAFLTKAGEGYDLTPETRLFLDRQSPLYLGAVAEFVGSRRKAERSASIAECVHAGRAVDDISGSVGEWVQFAESMVPVAAPAAAAAAEILSNRNAGSVRILDVAAGHGEFGLAFARRNEHA